MCAGGARYLLLRLGDALLAGLLAGAVDRVVLEEKEGEEGGQSAVPASFAAERRATECFLAAKAWAVAEQLARRACPPAVHPPAPAEEAELPRRTAAARSPAPPHFAKVPFESRR